ncbi:PTS transporter subunit EIIB [Anaeromicropila populeti]|uniref:PTS system, glucose-like IIB component n=1 Tax=Anaeromicropila populeti TaxID=37658 RepID=A0A1I6KSU2_9FIRM|nr:PTS glucose/sucrose transporter subunit IIB [Anaeromicropila populeti]SFR94098.1 PTS system, glucose-like IIB component [Anaeromicropila populeti]
MNYESLAETILHFIGGKENVKEITYCATRLRFTLVDDSKANTATLNATKGVKGVLCRGGQYQIVIGWDVGNVYKEIIRIGNFDAVNWFQ